MFPSKISNLPGQIEAALQFLRFSEEIQHPTTFDNTSRQGRDLTKTEFEVKDSALTVLLEYFNQPVPSPDHSTPNASKSSTDLSNDSAA